MLRRWFIVRRLRSASSGRWPSASVAPLLSPSSHQQSIDLDVSSCTRQAFRYQARRNKMSQPSWNHLPGDLPKPDDDGACNHLKNSTLPSVSLPSTAGSTIDLSALSGLTVIFCYPRTGAPEQVVPDEWNAIPGARGCTPQACSFRDASKEFLELGVSQIFGISTQDTPYQQEVKERIHLPYQLLSDEKLDFAKALKLPTFQFEGDTLIKRMSMVIEDGKIVWANYPDFPPDQSASKVVAYLKTRS